jgi:autotransporter-associated beta strand protein
MSSKVSYSAQSPTFTRARRLILGVSISALLSVSASAQLQWDNDGAAGPQQGPGDWLTSNGGMPWWNGSTNVAWTNGSDAQFGVLSTVVTAPQGVIVDDLNFPDFFLLAESYWIAGFLELGMGEGDHQIATNSNIRISASISGAQGFQKLGVGKLTLTGSNTYLGQVTVSEGTLTLNSANAIGPANRLSIAPGSWVENAVSEKTIGSLTGGGTLFFANGAPLNIGVDDTSTTFSGTIRAAERPLIGGGSIVKRGVGTLTLSGTVGSLIGITVEGGVLVVSGTNASVEATNINQGTLEARGGNAIGNASNVSVGSSGTLRLMASETIRELNGSGAVTLGDNTLAVTSGGIFSGVISGTGNLLMAGGAFMPKGEFTLTNPNSAFEGGLTIVEGSVIVPFVANAGVNSPLGSSGTVTFGDTTHRGRLVIDNIENGTTNRPVFVTPGGGIIETRNANSEVALSGLISGTGALTKSGPGRLTLIGDKTFSGSLVVADGTLRLGGGITGVPVSVLGPGTLDSFGPVAKSMGALTLAGGLMSPGLPGETDVFNTGSLTLSSGRLAINLNSLAVSGFDQLNVTGGVSFDGFVELSIELGYDPEDFVGSFPIIVNDGSDLTTFNGVDAGFFYDGQKLEDGTQFLVENNSFSQKLEIRYGLNADDNDVRLIVVPEPSAVFMVSLGLLFLGLRRSYRTCVSKLSDGYHS